MVGLLVGVDQALQRVVDHVLDVLTARIDAELRAAGERRGVGGAQRALVEAVERGLGDRLVEIVR